MLFDNNVLLTLAVYGSVIVVVFWVAMVIWAYRDMRARSRDGLAQLFAATVVAILNVPGLFVYILMRPRETLSEAYERSLEEEALLQEIEEKPTCPGCGNRVKDSWQACPYCHTRLKKSCRQCTELLELSWDLCPYCATDQSQYEPSEKASHRTGHVQPSYQYQSEPPPAIDDKWLASDNQQNQQNYPQYIDDEY